MRCSLIACAILALCGPSRPQNPKPVPAQPNQFEVGRHTFFDFGPPFDFYEIFVVRSTATATSIERITLTPAGDECIAPAKLETASASITESIPALLGTNPCTIPEKDLRRELKRRKKYLVFSGANVAMQVQCGSQARLIRSDILDRDMFDPAPNTPERTSWTMRLLERLDRAVGPGVMDKQVFPTSGKDTSPADGSDSLAQEDLGAGKYDALFQGAPQKPSDLYRAAQKHPPLPTVQLQSSVPLEPELFVRPEYPPLARMAHVKGSVSFTVEIDGDGATGSLTFESGPVLFQGVVRDAVSKWKFPKDASGQEIHATIIFGLNCSPASK
jgi:hypothetical protein